MTTLFGPFIIAFISICKGQHHMTCNVFPKDQYIQEGSSAGIFCQTSCVNSNIYWTLNNNNNVKESLSSTINSTHTYLVLRNVTSPLVTLQCHDAHTKQVLGGTTIRTYSKPIKIACILFYNGPENVGLNLNFTCKWEHRTNSSSKIRYTVLLSSHKEREKREVCKSTKATECSFEDIVLFTKMLQKENSQENNNFTITIRARTDAWEVDSDPYEFNPHHIWKMNLPTVAITAGSDQLLVEWTVSPESNESLCQIKYYMVSLSNEDTPKFVTETSKEYGNASIKEVESCTNYSISVRCAFLEAPWSNWSPEKTVLTRLNKKHFRLHLWRKVSDLGENGKRKVCVMWKGIPSTCRETFTYTISLTSQMKWNYTSCRSSACDVDLDHRAHRLNLTVSHNGIVFAEQSIYIPAVEETGLPKVTDIQTSADEGVIEVSWNGPPQPVSTYVIDWTHDGSQYYWRETKFANATLKDLLDGKPYNITVTPLLGDKTGQSEQAVQICSRVGVPGHTTITNVQAYDKSTFVSWETQSEGACSGPVLSYTVFYEAHNRTLNVTVDGKIHSIFLKDLIPNTPYILYVEGKGHTGNTRSRQMFFNTMRFDPRLLAVLSIVGSILILFVLGLGLCCVVQWKKCGEKPLPNPGLSSVATWLSQSQEKDTSVFQAFSNPSQDLIEQVFTEEADEPPLPSPAVDGDDNVASNETQEYSASAMPLPVSQDVQKNAPDEHGTPFEPFGESTVFLSTEAIPISPYRSQTSLQAPVQKISKQHKQVSCKQSEKILLKSVYVRLNMFEPEDVR
ncbi:unnamed protein product [Menidia menidia]|uniref:(Atlantic silverside) hypothetical protein n=1 Tax=Menidia menidia TaxID=238744 RepID=A0A8S4B771_9TELE|nr:unnamed protein product [Menidia menidia]